MQTAPVGNAHAGAHFGDRVIHSRRRQRCRARDNVQQRLTHLDGFSRYRPQLKALAIGQNDQADQAFALACDTVQIKLHQRLTLTHPCAFLHEQRKPFAIQLHGVDAHMHQQFGTIFGANRQRMPGAGDMDNHPVTGRVQAVIQRVDGNTVAHGAAGEHFVGNVAQGQHRATEWGA